METYGDAIEELNTASIDDLNQNISGLPLKIMEKTRDIPSIWVGSDGTIKDYNNLDSIKAKDTLYLQKQLAIMKSQNEPIKVNILGKTDYIYYKDSDLLDKLTYYPLALILILILFLGIVYMGFLNRIRLLNKNRLWTGMAKETAHQIGTPLSSLLGWIEILKSENVDESYIAEMSKDIDRLNTIANRFSKIGSVPELKENNIVSVAKQAFDYLESRSSKQVSFIFSTSENELNSNINTELFGWVIEI